MLIFYIDLNKYNPVRQEVESSHTTGICRPFPEVSSSFPKHWAITLSRENPLQSKTPASRYWPCIRIEHKSLCAKKYKCHKPSTLRGQ